MTGDSFDYRDLNDFLNRKIEEIKRFIVQRPLLGRGAWDSKFRFPFSAINLRLGTCNLQLILNRVALVFDPGSF